MSNLPPYLRNTERRSDDFTNEKGDAGRPNDEFISQFLPFFPFLLLILFCMCSHVKKENVIIAQELNVSLHTLLVHNSLTTLFWIRNEKIIHQQLKMKTTETLQNNNQIKMN